MTRIRVECSHSSVQGLTTYLANAVGKLREEFGGEWEEEKPVEIQTTANGYWGYVTIRRKDASKHGSVSAP